VRRPAGIYKRGRIYWITYLLKGRQCFESSHSSDLRAAVGLLQRRKAEIVQDRIVISPSQAPHFSEAIGMYISQIENQNTRKRYKLAGSVLLEHLGDPKISNLNPVHFDRFKDERISAGVTPAGVNRELALARACLNLAVERRLIPYSPFAGVKLFDETKHRRPPRSLSFAEESVVLSCCDLRLRTLVTFLVESGQRVGIEALPSKWSDLDFQEEAITVAHSKTAAGMRVIPMTTLCKSVLLEWRAATEEQSEYVFFNPQNPATHIRSVKTAWRNALKAAGLAHFPIYNCRHTFATRLSAAGVPDAIVDQLLGHSRGDILSFYTARVPEYLRDAIHRLEKLREVKESGSKTDNWAPSPSRPIMKASNLIQ
jgi:integrase